MPIRYFLVENRMTPDPDDFFANVVPIATVDLDELVQRVKNAGTTVTEADIRAVTTTLIQEVLTALAEGNRVNLNGLVQMYGSISGVFNGAADTFDASRHVLQLAAQPAGSCIAFLRANAQMEKQPATEARPVLLSYHNLATDSTNTTVTPGTIGTIDGSRLKFNPTGSGEGIFFVPEAGGAAVVVPTTNVQQNKPARLVFLVPPLVAGQWRLEVRNRYGLAASAPVRVGALDSLLTRP